MLLALFYIAVGITLDRLVPWAVTPVWNWWYPKAKAVYDKYFGKSEG